MSKYSALFSLLALCSTLSFGQRGADMPYTRYESEDAVTGGGALLYEAPEFMQEKTASEASSQKYVGLPSSGSYLEWTVNEPADGINMRFTMPDGNDGEGLDGSLDVFVNDSKVKTVNLTSYWAWQYFPSTEPENTPGENPRMRFDEVHFLLDSPLASGDVLRIEKTNSDGLEYGVDFIEIEAVPEKITQPAGSYSVTDYGAIADDGNDDLTAFNQCISAADADGMDVYIPEGKFSLNAPLLISATDMKITGAGMWYTEIHFSTDDIQSGGIVGEDGCSNLEFCNVYISTMLNSRFINGSYAIYKCFMDTYGSNSYIHHVWEEHFECGFWLGDYDDPVVYNDNLVISHCRIRNNYADGVNFCQGTSSSTVEHSSLRNNGDDALACWPDNTMGARMAENNVFMYNTIEHNWRAGGIAIFGGDGHEAHHNVIRDAFAGSGIRLNTTFPGYHFDNTTEIRFYENTIENCGTSKDLWNGERGAIDLEASGSSINNITFENIDIINAQRDAVQIGYGGGFSNINFYNISINGTGTDPYTASRFTQEHEGKAIMVYTGSGEAYFNNLSMENIEAAEPLLVPDGFNLTIENENVPLEGISVTPSEMEMADGETAQVEISFSPSNASDKTVSWQSSDESVVTVSSTGTYSAGITAQSTGSAAITATSGEGGHTASCTVTVTPAVNITATDDSASESGDTAAFLIQASGISEETEISYEISGTASSDDYSVDPVLSGSVSISPDNPFATFVITPTDDDEFEGRETVTLTLQNGSGYQLGGSTTASITIFDNDSPPLEAPVICYTEEPVAIDQNVEALWDNTPSMPLSSVTIGSMPEDFSGKWRALFDEASLYVLVEVSDEILNNDSGTDWWLDDVVEIYIDGDNSKDSSYDGVNDFQLGFRWNDETVNIGDYSVNNIDGIDFSMYGTDSGYTLEASIPWNNIGISPEIGYLLGFEVAVDDDDSGGRDAQIATFSQSDQLFTDPSLFGSVYLTQQNTEIKSQSAGKAAPIYSFNLFRNYPNPFNTKTVICYDLPKAVDVNISVYNIKGQYVTTLVDGFRNAGRHRISFNAGNLSSGIYMYLIIAGEYVQVRRMMLQLTSGNSAEY